MQSSARLQAREETNDKDISGWVYFFLIGPFSPMFCNKSEQYVKDLKMTAKEGRGDAMRCTQNMWKEIRAEVRVLSDSVQQHDIKSM